MDFSEAIAGKPSTPNDLPIPVRNPPRVCDEDRTSMTVLKQQGVTVTELAELFGFTPATVRRQIARVQGAELDAIRQVVNAELYALNRLVSKDYLIALLERNPNRLHTDKNGKDIPGAYVVTDAEAMKVVEKATVGLQAAASPANMDKNEAGSGSILSNWASNEEALNRVVQSLPVGVKLKLDQSLTVEASEDSSDGSPSAVDAPFSVEEGS